ncbi:50S ribosomal protein L24e [Nanobdella aerobiophila]|uniref:Large ribosomal subunit protein eL24 n=1 Tax=Nanobdella aerobiophila TaxID=2586965 RepID=A0A915SCQ8_9ARCH|nr:50S ribosomal protein L24e [Nanobdella aerobiophila]BBL45598.1 50S ribosomal protein L24e [Nanobdella aerobiophila]
MVVKNNCSFCGNQIEPGTGLLYSQNDGRVYYFCSNKCYKNWKLNRPSKELKWTNKYGK